VLAFAITGFPAASAATKSPPATLLKANGKLFGLQELITPDGSFTNGFAQGRKYLGSFVDNGPKDSNPAIGQFNLDLSGLDLGPGSVTVTANYSADPPGTHNGRTHTSNFSNPIGLIPGGAISVGLTNTVSDVAIWYNSTGNYITNGPVNTAAQTAPLDNWEPYIGVMGDTTFLIGFNTFADDQTIPAGATISPGVGAPFQRFAVAFQPAAGGAARIGEHLFTDAGAPYRGVSNYRRQNGNPQRVAGDKRLGATTFLPASETSIGQNPAFQSDSRWTSNACYNADNAYVTVQPFVVLHLSHAVFASSDATMSFYWAGGTTSVPVNLVFGAAFSERFVGSMQGWYTLAGSGQGDIRVVLVMNFLFGAEGR